MPDGNCGHSVAGAGVLHRLRKVLLMPCGMCKTGITDSSGVSLRGRASE